MEGILVPRQPPSNYSSGRIERIDLGSGAVEVLYDECDGRPLRAPNDLVFDGHGGFYFTDHGLREERTADRTGVFYAQPDGSSIREVVPPLDSPNGLGLSPDGTRLYVAETYSAAVWYWEVTGPGEVDGARGPAAARRRDAHAAARASSSSTRSPWTARATCASATLGSGGITSVSPEDGSVVEFVECGDLFVTNICFGGEDLRTAYITLSGAGKLVRPDVGAAGPGAAALGLSPRARTRRSPAREAAVGTATCPPPRRARSG